MSKKSLNAEELDLSLTGSQLLSPMSAGRRPATTRSAAAGKQRPNSATGQRPNSATGQRPNSTSTQRDKAALNVVNGLSSRQSGSSRGRQRSNSQSTPRQVGNTHNSSRQTPGNQDVTHQISSRSEGRSHRGISKSSSTHKGSARDDFLALFESSTQPKILRPGANRSQALHKGSARGARPAWLQSSPLNSARSTGTGVDGEWDPGSQAAASHQSQFTHSVFQPVSARTSSTVEDEDPEAGSELPLDNQSYRQHSHHHSHHHHQQQQQQQQQQQLHAGDHSHGQSPRDELRLNLDQRAPFHEDVNFNFEHAGRLGGELQQAQEEMRHSRNSLYGENAYGNDLVGQKSHKLNSIANNMTSQAMSPGTKMALMDMENSYQNIKPKTPVNQVRQPRAGQHSGSGEEYGQDGHLAAVRIQRWFRRHRTRSRAGEAAMKRLMDVKHAEKVKEMSQSKDYLRSSQADAEHRKRIREEKAQQARQAAIQDLHKKREDRRKALEEKKAGTEVKFLQPSGKTTMAPATKSNNNNNNKKKRPGTATPKAHQQVTGSDSDNEQLAGAVGDSARSAAGGSNSNRIDDIFQNNSPRPSVHRGEEGHEQDDDDRTISALQTERSPRSISALQTERSGSGAGSAAGAVGGAEGGAMGGSLATSGTKTTLDDLMETLKKLEEEDRLPAEGGHNKNKTPRNWLDDLEKKGSEDECQDLMLTAHKLKKLNPTKDNIRKSGFLTDEKLKSIISFLDEVETADRLDTIDQGNDVAPTEVLSNELLLRPPVLGPTAEEVQEMEHATMMASEVTSKVLTQRLELEEKQRSVTMLQKALNQQRELTIRHARETEKEMKKRLDVQKEEYEETIKRHLGFIDQLIDGKKSLSEKCEGLVNQLKLVDKRYQDKMKLDHQNHEIELKKIKEVQGATEKLRRERWIDEKTKKIKEMTVKGLEPEIQRLIAKHKAEIKKVKSIHEAELLESDERAGQRYVAMTEELRDQLAKEKEAACARERELARSTYEKQLQQEEEAYQQQRRRLYQEVQDEKDRLAASTSRQRAELDKMQRQLEDSASTSTAAMRREYEKAREEQERRHATELRQLKEQLSVEKAAWEENYKKKQETWAIAKERELKEQVRRERDKEIEEVINRLEEDTQMAREECERVAENRIKRIRTKYEGEITELERTERLTTQKYNETKALLAEFEGENGRMKVTLKQKSREIEELKQLLEKRNEERDRVGDVIRQEFADKIVATEEECKRLKNEMSELKARSRLEVERAKAQIDVVTRSKEEEMEEVHKRVKQAIVKKEEVVNQLKAQYQSALKRADHLEGLLEQQRKQLLKK